MRFISDFIATSAVTTKHNTTKSHSGPKALFLLRMTKGGKSSGKLRLRLQLPVKPKALPGVENNQLS